MDELINEGLNNKKSKNNKIFDIIIVSFLILLTLFVIFVAKFWVALSVVDGTSMNNTLNDGDILVTDMLKKPNRGDVIVFKQSDTANYIKRVIAVGGDTIFNDDKGNIYLIKKGETQPTLLEEPYIIPATKDDTTWGNIYCVVPDGEYFVMGDNRPVSEDSRLIGTVKEEQVLGVVVDFWIKNKELTSKIFAFRR